MNENSVKIQKIERILFWFFFVLGILVRGWRLGNVPGGLNQDEAFAGYEAFSLLNYGIDSSGYSFPVYFNSWGSGMNVLNSYLMIPFMAVFGANTIVVRLPQFIIACLSLFVVYKLFEKMYNRQLALIGLLFFAINPWHIMLARWGLESNLAPGFLLFGLYFFVLAVDNPKYYVVSFISYGLSLYCYSAIWPMVPLMLLLQLLYLLYTGKFKFNQYFVIATIILMLMAIPLILFLAINYGYMEEICTSFFSIPELTKMREKDITFWDKRANLQQVYDVVVQQDDGQIWNVIPKFGLYYKWSTAFAIIGLVVCIKDLAVSILKRKYRANTLLLVPFGCSVFTGCFVWVNVNRINSIHIPIVCLIAIGIYTAIIFLRRWLKYIEVVVCIALIGCLIHFSYYYFTEYKAIIGPAFHEGLEEAVERACFLAGEEGQICVDGCYSYSKILFYSEFPTDEYCKTIEYVNYPSEFMVPKSYGNFKYGISEYEKGIVYIVSPQNVSQFAGEEWNIDNYENVFVVY